MSEPTRRFSLLPDGTMHESAHGNWVRHDALTAATKRAEAAEAEREKCYDSAVKERVRRVSAEAASASADAEADGLRAERDALRKDAARYRWLKPQLEMDWDLGNPVYLSLGLTVEVPTHVEVSFDLDATIDAALAVQP